MADTKNGNLCEYLNKVQTDVACLPEGKVYWKNVKIQDRLPEQTLGWWESLHISTGYLFYLSLEHFNYRDLMSCPKVRQFTELWKEVHQRANILHNLITVGPIQFPGFR
jgi:hypothetical protein